MEISELNKKYDNFKRYEQEAIDRIGKIDCPEIQKQSDINLLWGCNVVFALHGLLIEKNIGICKVSFHNCGRLDEYAIKKYDSRILDAGISHLSYALLSDNISLIQRYAVTGHKHYMYMVEKGHSTPLFILQKIIQDDWEQVRWGIHIMDTKTLKRNKPLVPDRDFYEGILNRDSQQVSDAIGRLLKNHKKRNKYLGMTSSFISSPALGYAKLAWMKGIKVEIDHPLVPRELLPVEPLKKYEDKYAFLKELDYNIN